MSSSQSLYSVHAYKTNGAMLHAVSAHTPMPAGSQQAPFTHFVVLANELEDRDLVVLRELVFGRVLCHCFI